MGNRLSSHYYLSRCAARPRPLVDLLSGLCLCRGPEWPRSSQRARSAGPFARRCRGSGPLAPVLDPLSPVLSAAALHRSVLAAFSWRARLGTRPAVQRVLYLSPLSDLLLDSSPTWYRSGKSRWHFGSEAWPYLTQIVLCLAGPVTLLTGLRCDALFTSTVGRNHDYY